MAFIDTQNVWYLASKLYLIFMGTKNLGGLQWILLGGWQWASCSLFREHHSFNLVLALLLVHKMLYLCGFVLVLLYLFGVVVCAVEEYISKVTVSWFRDFQQSLCSTTCKASWSKVSFLVNVNNEQLNSWKIWVLTNWYLIYSAVWPIDVSSSQATINDVIVFVHYT